MLRCPTCRSPVRPREENEAFPFCSPRCKAIDLGKWFTGNYRVPGEPVQRPDTASPPPDDDGDDGSRR